MNIKRHIVAYLDGLQAKVNALREFALTPALSRRERGYAVCVDAGYFR